MNPLNNNEKVPIYNPDSEDFTVTYDTNGNNQPISYTLHAGEIEYFEPFIADHIANHLANKLMFKRPRKINPSADKENILKEIKTINFYE